MSASEHLNPEQHEPSPSKRTKTWSSVRKKPSIQDAHRAALAKKKAEEKTKGYSDRSRSAAQKRQTMDKAREWSETKQTLDRNLRKYDRRPSSWGFMAPVMFTDEDFKNEGPSESPSEGS